MFDNDKDLISRCLKKDIAAEYELYRRFAPKMYGICLRYGGNSTEAKEILQQGFIQLFSHLDQYSFEGSPEAWVERVFITTAVNHIKKTLKFQRHEEYSEASEYSMVQEQTTSYIAVNEMLEVIQNLPQGYRIVFNLHAIENYDHNEIAKLLGITVGTSKSQLSRAKEVIRKKLRERKQQYIIAYGTMKDLDPLEEKFKSAFSDYKVQPPASVWENLKLWLHPVVKPIGLWARIATFSLLTEKPISFYFASTGAAFLLFISVIYVGMGSRHSIRGHAYAGNMRLHSGTAVLFQSEDKSMPWDSVAHYRSAIIDHYGHFQFSRVSNGKYLLRIAPAENSEEAAKYKPSWYELKERSDSCRLIVVRGGDEYVDAHLVKGEK